MTAATEGPGNAPRPLTVRDFPARKRNGEKLVMVSAYDALFARLADDGGVDAVLVGDSLGNVIDGRTSTLSVTLDQIIYHACAVRRGLQRALLVVDMPFLTYQVSVPRALLNCGRVMQETGASAVKLEGGGPRIARVVHAVIELGVPVMGHLGFTPQSVHALGGARVQGREPDAAQRLLEDAKRLEDAGAFAIVLEMIPAAVAERITASVSVPTIGIGAGAKCDGQVLVMHDLIGLNDGFSPKFLKRYAALAEDARRALRTFAAEVRDGSYPGPEHSF